MTQGGKGGGPTRLGGSGSSTDAGGAGGSSGGFPASASAATSASSASAPASASSSGPHLTGDLGAGASASMATLAGDASMVGEILDGRYRIVKKLGEGGMGEVYAAEHVHIAKKVAIKLLRKEVVSNEEAVSRFRQEARSASTIGHRNIIGIDDFGQLKDGRIYLCMEYLDGAPLNDIIVNPQPADRLLNILIQTGHGLAAAHAKGIIHRDMKPENIFVTTTPSGEDIPKILDFGIAKVGGQDGSNNLTKTGTIFGTPYYMAPEQALGQAVDARVDIYALGVILYEVFSGSLPFQGESFMGVLTQHITTDAEPVAQRAAKAGRTLPPGLPELIARAMAKDPERRFRTMDELVSGLVAIYRTVAGAGMSSYMEAQPRASSSQPSVGPGGHPGHAGGSAMLATMPAAMAGPGTPGSGLHAIPPGGSAVMAPGGGPNHAMQGPPGSGPMPMPPGYGPGPYPPGPPGQVMPGMHGGPHGPGASGLYAGDSAVVAPRRGKGLVIGIVVAALAVVGVVVALVATSKGKDDKVAAGELDAAAPQPAAIDAGAGTGSGSGSNGALDAGALVVTPGIDAGARVDDAVDAAVVTPPGNTVVVLVHSRTPSAVVYDNGQKLGKVPQTIMVAAGEEHTVVLKAPGFKDEELTVDGREPRIDVVMARVAGTGPGTGQGSGPGTGHGSGPGTGHGSGPGTGHGSSAPPPPDCDNNPTDPRCSM